jgi:hypothetical protein
MVRRKREVGLGERYQARGQAYPQVWEVEYVYIDAQGIPHTRLFDVRCPATKRTVATAVLLDNSRYVPVAP